MEKVLFRSAQQNTTAITDWLTENNIQKVCAMALKMARILKTHNLFVCGNGGSLSQAQHFAEELTGRYRDDRAPLGCIALADSTHMSCVANDFGYDKVFSRSIEGCGKKGDGLLLLTTSGNSTNLIAASEAAKKQGVSTFALLGKGGGKLKSECDYEIIVPGESSDVVQNLHMVIIHLLIEGIEREIFPENYHLGMKAEDTHCSPVIAKQ